jgi:hypothetical protein
MELLPVTIVPEGHYHQRELVKRLALHSFDLRPCRLSADSKSSVDIPSAKPATPATVLGREPAAFARPRRYLHLGRDDAAPRRSFLRRTRRCARRPRIPSRSPNAIYRSRPGIAGPRRLNVVFWPVAIATPTSASPTGTCAYRRSQPSRASDASSRARRPYRGMTDRTRQEGRSPRWNTVCCATSSAVPCPNGAPVFGLRSKRGKLLELISTRIR